MFMITEDDASRIVELNLRELKNITTRGKRQAFYQIGAIATRTIRENIMVKPRYGRLETFRGRRRRASLPGESFANRSGDAKKTLGFEVHGAEEVEFGFRENGSTKYVEYLENGTFKMASRPTLKIASKSIVGKAQQIMETELIKAHNEGFTQ